MRHHQRRYLRGLVDRYCFYCGDQLSRRTQSIDHMVPLSRGGRNSYDNIVDACRECNTEKGCLTDEEFRAVLAYRRGLLTVDMLFPGELCGKEVTE